MFIIIFFLIGIGITCAQENQPSADIHLEGEEMDYFIEFDPETSKERNVCVIQGTSENPARIEWGEDTSQKVLIAQQIKVFWKPNLNSQKNSIAIPSMENLDKVVAEKNTKMTYQHFILTGHQCTYRPQKNAVDKKDLHNGIVTCIKNIVIRDGTHIGRGDIATYNMKNNTYSLKSKGLGRAQAFIPIRKRHKKD